MFCDACGAHLQPGQGYCVRCGKAVIGPVVGGGRVARHVHVLGILWIAYSALHLIGAAVLLILANTILLHMGRFVPPGTPPPPEFLHLLFTAIGWFLVAKGGAGLAAGVGLLQRQSWARVLTLVVACVSLINVPFGTALGVYTLWVLVSPGAEQEWQGMARG